ncbi:MAG: exonuclease SbcCD subunit D [Chloroflexi bacterium]|nr:exonuclease SbcCD subunit D [Chloroflexota bacterium]
MSVAPPITILHLSDTHLGVERYGKPNPETGLNTRLEDFLRCLDQAVDEALHTPVDLFLFAGDAYRGRDPNPTVQRELAARIHRLSLAGIPVFLLVGNHDVPAAEGRATALDIFHALEVPLVTVGRRPGVYRIETRHGPVQVGALPWLRRSALLAKEELRSRTLEEIKRSLEEHIERLVQQLVDQLDPATPAVFTTHLSVLGSKYGSEREIMVGQDVEVSRSVVAQRAFDYVALGHIHRYQKLGEDPLTLYSGSIERIDFGEEEEEKGYIIAHVRHGAAEHEFRPVPARRFVTVEVDATGEEPMEQVKAAIHRARVADAVVRMRIRATPSSWDHIDEQEIRRLLQEADWVAAIEKQIPEPARARVLDDFAESLTPARALARYVQVKQVEPDRARRVLEYGERLIHEVTS